VRVTLTDSGRAEADRMLSAIDALFADLVDYLGKRRARRS
jgi:DNA-binding MarR family transcriptional regulator